MIDNRLQFTDAVTKAEFITTTNHGLEKIEPLTGIIIESRWSPPSTSELTAKLNEVIERQNRIIDYLNEVVKK